MSVPAAMPAATLALVLVSAALWAACDFVRKQALALASRAVVQRACAAGQATLAGILFVLGDRALPTLNYLPFGLASAITSAAGTYCFLAALDAAPISASIPLLALTPAFTTLAAWLLLGQSLGYTALAGLALVLLGSWVANPIRRAQTAELRAFGFMAAAAVLWSLASTLDARSIQSASVPVHAMLCSLVTVAASYLDKSPRAPSPASAAHARSNWNQPRLLACACVCAAAALAQWYAVAAAPAGIVEGTKRAVGTLAALGLGAFLLGEQVSARRALGAFTLLAGAILLSIRA